MFYKIKKLDKRMGGSGYFAYKAELNGYAALRLKRSIEVRQWCWETFGPSAELSEYVCGDQNASWCWETTHKNYTVRYLFKTQEQVNLFVLRFG